MMRGLAPPPAAPDTPAIARQDPGYACTWAVASPWRILQHVMGFEHALGGTTATVTAS